MIRYKDNAELKLSTVITVSGETEYKRNCRKIKDKYYIMGEQCIEVEDKWYVANSKLITFDYENKKWVITKKTPLIYGIVNFKSKGLPIFGYFTQNKYNNVVVNISGYGQVLAINEQILIDAEFIENISDGVWFYKRDLSESALKRTSIISSQRVFKEKGYNIEDNQQEFKDKIEYFERYPLKISSRAARFGKLLGNTSFGCEIETTRGYIPDHIQWRTGVVICRDGSIDNAEYVTVPMRGAKGLVNLQEISKYLVKRTETNIKCSFHIHLGSLPTDRLFIVSLWALAIRIQDEVFKMFPYYKTEWKGIKKQDYNQKVRKLGTGLMRHNMKKDEFNQYIDEAYYRIFTFLNDGASPDDRYNRNNNQHQQSAKWNRPQRYFWLNFINLFFSERRTAEFRLHHNTVNSQKMINWLFICNAIVRYAEKNSIKILSDATPIKLDEILNYYGENFKTEESKFLSSYLKAYVENRKNYFDNDRKNGDFVSQAEQDEDKTFTFEFQGISNLF